MTLARRALRVIFNVVSYNDLWPLLFNETSIHSMHGGYVLISHPCSSSV